MREVFEGDHSLNYGADDEHYFVYPKEKTLYELCKEKNTTAKMQKEKVEDEEGEKHSSVCSYIDMINDVSQKLKIGFEQYKKAKEEEIRKLKNELAEEKGISDSLLSNNLRLVQDLDEAKEENQQQALKLDKVQSENKQLAQKLDKVQSEKQQLAHDSEATQAENRQLAYKLYQAQESNKQLAQKLDEVQTETSSWLMTWVRLRRKVRSWLGVREKLWRNAACWNINWKRLRRKIRSSVRNLMKQGMKSAVRISPFVG